MRAAAALVMAVLMLEPSLAQRPAPELDVKVAYLLNFARFTEWPAHSGDSQNDAFAICVLGRASIKQSIDTTLAGASVRGARVASRVVASARDAAGCRVLFVDASQEPAVAMILETLSSSDILTVSDMPRFLQRGGMIQFVTRGNRVRFEIDLATARNAGLQFSSELLRVAFAIRRGQEARP